MNYVIARTRGCFRGGGFKIIELPVTAGYSFRMVRAIMHLGGRNTISKSSPEETPNPRGDSKTTMLHVLLSLMLLLSPVFSESPLGFGVSSGEFIDDIYKLIKPTYLRITFLWHQTCNSIYFYETAASETATHASSNYFYEEFAWLARD